MNILNEIIFWYQYNRPCSDLFFLNIITYIVLYLGIDAIFLKTIKKIILWIKKLKKNLKP